MEERRRNTHVSKEVHRCVLDTADVGKVDVLGLLALRRVDVREGERLHFEQWRLRK